MPREDQPRSGRIVGHSSGAQSSITFSGAADFGLWMVQGDSMAEPLARPDNSPPAERCDAEGYVLVRNSNARLICNSCHAATMKLEGERGPRMAVRAGVVRCTECDYADYGPECKEWERQRNIFERERQQAILAAQLREAPFQINNYTFKPPADFKGRTENGLFFGIENEIEVLPDLELTRFTRHVYEAACGVTGANNLLYFKQDGTLRHGVEIVSHPMSFNYFDKNFPYAIFDVLQREGRNWYGRPKDYNCGLHVHMSREAFGRPVINAVYGTKLAPAYHLYKFVQFIYSFPGIVQFVAGREGAVLRGMEMCSYNKRLYGARGAWDAKVKDMVLSTDAFLKDLAKGKSTHPDRHMAVNLQNKNTIEMRMFRATTNPRRLRAVVQFCDALFYYTKKAKLHCKYDPSREMSEEGLRRYVAEHPIRYNDLLGVLNNDPDCAV